MGKIKRGVFSLLVAGALFASVSSANATVDVTYGYLKQIAFGTGYYSYGYAAVKVANEGVADVTLHMPDTSVWGPTSSSLQNGFLVYVFKIPAKHVNAANQAVVITVDGDKGGFDSQSLTCTASSLNFVCH